MSGILTKARPSFPSIRGHFFARACRFTDSALMPSDAAASWYVIQLLSMGRSIGAERSPRQSSGVGLGDFEQQPCPC